MRDLNGVIVFLSIICPINFTRVRKNVIYPGLLFFKIQIVCFGFVFLCFVLLG